MRNGLQELLDDIRADKVSPEWVKAPTVRGGSEGREGTTERSGAARLRQPADTLPPERPAESVWDGTDLAFDRMHDKYGLEMWP